MRVTKYPQTNYILDALGDQVRRDILLLLRDGPLPVGAIARQFPISRPAISKHLRILEQAGLVAYSAQGTRNIFYLRPAGFAELKLYLELFWDSALANFQRVAEESDQAK
jgi:predicted transcriptional regulator